MNYKAIEKRNERIRAIENEFDEPLADIVSGFREMRYSYKDIAGALEVPYPTFIKWQRKLGLTDDKINWRNGERPNSLDVKARKLGYHDIGSMISELRYNGKGRKEIGDMLNCHPKSLYRRTPKDALYLNSPTTERQKEARRKTIGKVNEDRRKAGGGV